MSPNWRQILRGDSAYGIAKPTCSLARLLLAIHDDLVFFEASRVHLGGEQTKRSIKFASMLFFSGHVAFSPCFVDRITGVGPSNPHTLTPVNSMFLPRGSMSVERCILFLDFELFSIESSTYLTSR